MTDTVSSILLKILKRHGIRNVFGLPAAQIGLLMDGAAKDPFFNYVTTRHEEAAGHMAHAVGKLTGSMGLCFGTVGPGATNMVPGVAAAWADNIPLLVVTPNNQSRTIDPFKDALQSADHIGLYKSITKWSATIRYPDRAPELIERAIHIARSGRPGPVHLDIPCDIGAAPCEHVIDSVPVIARARPVPNDTELDEVAARLTAAANPVLLAGGGLVRAGGVDAFRRFVAETGILATTTLNARGALPPDHSPYIGCGALLGGRGTCKALSEADLVLAVGCKFSSWVPIDKPPLYPRHEGQSIIQVDIEPTVLGNNQPIAMGLVGDAQAFLEKLLDRLQGARLEPSPAWLEAVTAEHAAYRAEVDALADSITTSGTGLLNEAALARAAAAELPDNVIIVYDGGQIMEWAHTFIRPRDPLSFGFVPGMGHLGFGLPFANAAKLNFPDRPVVVVTGDGAMGMTGQELETAVRYGLDVTVVVANDSCWGMYRPLGEQVFRNPNFGTTVGRVDFATVAEGYGARGYCADSVETLGEALRTALGDGSASVIDVTCDFTPHPLDAFWPGVVMKGVELAPVEL